MSLHDVSCANNNRFAVVVCFRVAFYASGMRIYLEIFEFKTFFKFCTIMMTYYFDDELAYLRFGVANLFVA